MWNIYQDKFVSSDDEYLATLVCLEPSFYKTIPIEAKKLYDNLTEKEKQHIINRLTKGENE